MDAPQFVLLVMVLTGGALVAGIILATVLMLRDEDAGIVVGDDFVLPRADLDAYRANAANHSVTPSLDTRVRWWVVDTDDDSAA